MNNSTESTIGKQISFSDFLQKEAMQALDQAVEARDRGDDQNWGLRTQDMIESLTAADSWERPINVRWRKGAF